MKRLIRYTQDTPYGTVILERHFKEQIDRFLVPTAMPIRQQRKSLERAIAKLNSVEKYK